MKSYARSHLADESLASRLVPGATRVIDALADHLADLGEFDARKLYLPAAYPWTSPPQSMPLKNL